MSDAEPPVTGAPGSLMIVDQSTGTRLAVTQTLMGFLVLGFVVGIIAGSVIMSFILFIGIVLLAIYVVPRTIEATKWQPAELHLAESPLGLGSVTTVEYVRSSRKPAKHDRAESVQIELACTESATYTVGTDTRTDTNDVYEHRASISGAFTNGTYRARFPLQIPVERGAPTMDLGNNEVTWKLEIGGGNASLPSRRIGFVLTVMPVLVVPDSLEHEIQDA